MAAHNRSGATKMEEINNKQGKDPAWIEKMIIWVRIPAPPPRDPPGSTKWDALKVEINEDEMRKFSTELFDEKLCAEMRSQHVSASQKDYIENYQSFSVDLFVKNKGEVPFLLKKIRGDGYNKEGGFNAYQPSWSSEAYDIHVEHGWMNYCKIFRTELLYLFRVLQLT